jgi:hypothetical protein
VTASNGQAIFIPSMMGDKSMQKNFNSQPIFTWQHDLLFCGSLLIARVRFCSQENGDHHFQIERAAFPDALAQVGSAYWNNQPFHLKGKTFTEIAKIVEFFYFHIFDKMDLDMTIQ